MSKSTDQAAASKTSVCTTTTGSTTSAAAACGDSLEPATDVQLSIGDLAEEFGITTRAIRFYEARGLLAPDRRGAQRTFTRRDRARLILILRAKNLGFSLEDVAEYLKLYDADPTQQAQTKMLLEKVESALVDLNAKRADLDRTLRELKEIRSRCLAHLHGVGNDV